MNNKQTIYWIPKQDSFIKIKDRVLLKCKSGQQYEFEIDTDSEKAYDGVVVEKSENGQDWSPISPNEVFWTPPTVENIK